MSSCSVRSFLVLLFLHLAVVATTTAFVSPTHFRRSNAVVVGVWGSSSSRNYRRQSAGSLAMAAAASGPAILDRPAETIERTSRRQTEQRPVRKGMGEGSEAWEVRIYNDGLNTREHVARSLVQVTGLSELQAYQTMMRAHYNGIAVVGRWVYEIAEMFHDALKKKGIVCDIVPVGGDE